MVSLVTRRYSASSAAPLEHLRLAHRNIFQDRCLWHVRANARFAVDDTHWLRGVTMLGVVSAETGSVRVLRLLQMRLLPTTHSSCFAFCSARCQNDAMGAALVWHARECPRPLPAPSRCAAQNLRKPYQRRDVVALACVSLHDRCGTGRLDHERPGFSIDPLGLLHLASTIFDADKLFTVFLHEKPPIFWSHTGVLKLFSHKV